MPAVQEGGIVTGRQGAVKLSKYIGNLWVRLVRMADRAAVAQWNAARIPVALLSGHGMVVLRGTCLWRLFTDVLVVLMKGLFHNVGGYTDGGICGQHMVHGGNRFFGLKSRCFDNGMDVSGCGTGAGGSEASAGVGAVT